MTIGRFATGTWLSAPIIRTYQVSMAGEGMYIGTGYLVLRGVSCAVAKDAYVETIYYSFSID